METRKRVLGPEHPSTLTSMNDLAWMWKVQGRKNEALDLITACVRLSMELASSGLCWPCLISCNISTMGATGTGQYQELKTRVIAILFSSRVFVNPELLI